MNTVSTKNKIKFKLSFKDIDEDAKRVSLSQNQLTNFDNRYLKGSSITIKNVEIKDVFKVNYQLCFNDKNCIPSYEYLRAPLDANYDKSLVKVEANYQFNSKLDIINASKLGDLLVNYGIIDYTINGSKKELSLKEVKPTKINSNTTTYLEVPNNIKNADRIDLIIKIRNYNYVYHVK